MLLVLLVVFAVNGSVATASPPAGSKGLSAYRVSGGSGTSTGVGKLSEAMLTELREWVSTYARYSQKAGDYGRYAAAPERYGWGNEVAELQSKLADSQKMADSALRRIEAKYGKEVAEKLARQVQEYGYSETEAAIDQFESALEAAKPSGKAQASGSVTGASSVKPPAAKSRFWSGLVDKVTKVITGNGSKAAKRAGQRGVVGAPVVVKVAGVAVVAAVVVKVSNDPENQKRINGFLAKEIDERGGGRDGAVMFAVDVFVRGVGGVDLGKLRDGSYAGFLSDAADSWLPSMPATDSLKSALKTASDVESIERPVSRNSVDRQVDAVPAAVEEDLGSGPDAAPAPADAAVPEVPSAPGGVPSVPVAPEVTSEVGKGGGGVPEGKGVKGGGVGSAPSGSSGEGNGIKVNNEEGGDFDSPSGGLADDDPETDTPSDDSRSLMGGSQDQDQDQQESDSGGDDDKGGLVNPFDDSVGGGVGGDRANVLLDRKGVVGVVGDLVSLISSRESLGVFDLVADWDAGGGGEGPDVGPRGGFLQALEGLFGSVLDSKDSGMARSGLAGLVADWGDETGPNDGGGPGDGGPGTPGGFVSNNEGDGTDGSKPTVGPKGGSKDGGQRVASTRTTTVGSRTVQSNRTVTTTTQQKSGAVKAPTVPQSQKLAAPQAPTAITNTGPATQLQSPATKLSSPSNTTNQIQNPTSQLSYSE